MSPFSALDGDSDLMRRRPGQRTRWFSPENPDGLPHVAGLANQGWKGRASVLIPAGGQVDLVDLQGSGRITRIWMTFDDRSPEALAALRLVAHWDDAESPAVDVPLGDFFLAPTGRPVPFASALLSNPEGRSFCSTIPMPYRSAARLSILNRSDRRIPHLFYEVDVTETDAPDPDVLWFHARFTAADRVPFDAPFAALPRTDGEGRLLGLGIGVVTAPEYGDLWFGESEIRMRLDGESTWTLSGTGLEDHIGSAWGLGEFAHPEQGCLVAEAEGREWALYRFHLSDPVLFRRAIAVDLLPIGGGTEDRVRAAMAAGAPVRPVTIDHDEHGLTRLLDDPSAIDDPRYDGGWINFGRSDACRVTAYLALDRPGA